MNFNPFEKLILENDRVILTALVFEDIEKLRPIAFEDETLLDYSAEEIHTEEALNNYLRTALKQKETFIKYPFTIYDKKMGAYAGSTSYGYISNKDLRVEIGWTWIGRRFQGTGLNKACKFLLLEYAFETLEFERVELRADRRNKRSRRAIEKLGAQYEGMLRSHTVMSDGYRRDTVFYGILKDEWTTLRKTIFKEFI